MTEAQFKASFLLSPLSKKTLNLPPSFKQAAVLIPFVKREGKLYLLLTRRALHLRHHPGQISFPGGGFEPDDIALKTTALRETYEEIGIEASSINIIGQLGDYPTVSNYIVRPFVGFVAEDYQLTLDANEVDDAFEVPWRFFTERESHHCVQMLRKGRMHDVHFMPFNDRMIWGTTAAMIHDLLCHFE
jgi:8-oxo-dGTP pyrophosphatase MutT (NUDIX family)